MSWNRAVAPFQSSPNSPNSSSWNDASNTPAALPAAEQSPKPADAAEVKAELEQPATPAAAAESRTAPSDQAPRAGKRSPGLKSIEAAQAIAKIGQDQDGPPPPSTPLEIASSLLWPELLILEFAANEAKWGLAGLFACQEPLHRTTYKAGPKAYARDMAAYVEERQRLDGEIKRWQSALQQHALPIESRPTLREICEAAYDELSMREEWEHLRAKEPWRDWLHNREVVDPFLGVRMPGPPVVDLDCVKLVTSLFNVVYGLSEGADRPTVPAAKRSASDALAAVDAIIAWCDDLMAADGVVSLKNIESVCVALKARTIRNELSKSKNRGENPPIPVIKGQGRAWSQYRYSELREWLLRRFPKKTSSLPRSFSEVAKILQSVQS